MADINADIDAIKRFHDALVSFRYAQRTVVERAAYEIDATRASLERKANRWQLTLDQRQAELAACQRKAAQAAAKGYRWDCSAETWAVQEAIDRLEHIQSWQDRIEQEASAFVGPASRFRECLDVRLARTDSHLLAVVKALEAARGIQVPEA